MSVHHPGNIQPIRHYITPTLYVGMSGKSSHEPGHAMTGLPDRVTCEACRRLMETVGYHREQDVHRLRDEHYRQDDPL